MERSTSILFFQQCFIFLPQTRKCYLVHIIGKQEGPFFPLSGRESGIPLTELLDSLFSGPVRVTEVGPAAVLKHMWTANVLQVWEACVKAWDQGFLSQSRLVQISELSFSLSKGEQHVLWTESFCEQAQIGSIIAHLAKPGIRSIFLICLGTLTTPGRQAKQVLRLFLSEPYRSRDTSSYVYEHPRASTNVF